jgi:short-subunit dehydrogenase/acyl dehydratase/acyl carrier protein
MSSSKHTINDFEVGDYVVFERSFSAADFAAFAKISGDHNPLHHDPEFAAHSRFERPIVPLHLVLAPLSMIAGMVFPGEPSLYLSHEARALIPVSYGEPIRYSARIEAVNESLRVLSVRVLGVLGSQVVLDAAMRVQAQVAEWGSAPALPVRKGAQPALALVTGSSGEIGSAIAYALGRQGWRLLLQVRGDDERRRRLKDLLKRNEFEAEFFVADLAAAKGQAALAKAVADREDIALIVHAASPAPDGPLEELVAVNFSALKELTDAAIPRMLMRQNAAVVLIGSSATEFAQPGWEAYSGAKSMAANLVDKLERSYATYGVRGFTVMPGFVATRFSEAFRGQAPALLPQEVAEAVLSTIADMRRPNNVVMLEPGNQRRGRLGFHTPAVPASPGRGVPLTCSRAEIEEADDNVSQHAAESPVTDVVSRVLGLPGGIDLREAALGITPGWDSLKHIELLLELEAALGIRFGSEEMDAAHHFSALRALCEKKLAEKVRP